MNLNRQECAALQAKVNELEKGHPGYPISGKSKFAPLIAPTDFIHSTSRIRTRSPRLAPEDSRRSQRSAQQHTQRSRERENRQDRIGARRRSAEYAIGVGTRAF
jgi:hypothetical protein